MDLYAFLGRVAHTAARPLLRLYANERMTRVRAVIINEHDEILMVKSWFGRQRWSLPGGGVHRHEPFPVAAAREVFEETGLTIKPGQFTDLGSFPNPDPVAPYIVNCQMVRITKQPLRIAGLRRTEVLDAAWKPLKHLPAERSPVVDPAIALATARH